MVWAFHGDGLKRVRKIQKKSSPRGHTESPILREALLLKILADREVVCILTILPVPVFPFWPKQFRLFRGGGEGDEADTRAAKLFNRWVNDIWHQLSSVQSLSCVWLFVTPWTAARQTSLSITNSQSLLRLMSTESVIPSNHLILCRPFSSCLQSFPASGSFQKSQLFASGG